MTTLSEFLLARYDEDWLIAEYGGEPVINPPPEMKIWHVLAATRNGNRYGTMEPIAEYDPAKMRADIEAKRRVVAIAGAGAASKASATANPALAFGRVHDGASILQALAQPYVDHPDFREEWAL